MLSIVITGALSKIDKITLCDVYVLTKYTHINNSFIYLKKPL